MYLLRIQLSISSVPFFLQSDWNEGLKLASTMSFRFPRLVSTPLSSVVPSASEAGRDLMEALLQWDPHCRPSAAHVRNELRGKEVVKTRE